MRKLTRNERKMAIIASFIIVPWTLFQFTISPINDRIKVLERIIPNKEKQLNEIKTLRHAILSHQEQLDNLIIVPNKVGNPFSIKNSTSRILETCQILPDAYKISENNDIKHADYIQQSVSCTIEQITNDGFFTLLREIQDCSDNIVVLGMNATNTTSGLNLYIELGAIAPNNH